MTDYQRAQYDRQLRKQSRELAEKREELRSANHQIEILKAELSVWERAAAAFGKGKEGT